MGINDSETEFENVRRAPIISNISQELVLKINYSDTEFESVSRVPIKSTENMHNSQIEFTKRGIIENFKQKFVENERKT